MLEKGRATQRRLGGLWADEESSQRLGWTVGESRRRGRPGNKGASKATTLGGLRGKRSIYEGPVEVGAL